ncbi:superoxide dismutase [Mesorhizobium sp. LHD-90]|uniref:superoxide dismutase n=1 Tax=Mesorhizobium sp. LHD-90 TaxID=3071414 RepID=UPI0027DF4EF2|nr:superoxide dismutase [Mesorhizobium sp. LHD-90]MDQ6435038.1 superoxide dismutase [Mesorhizobium sp. LHD-90]
MPATMTRRTVLALSAVATAGVLLRPHIARAASPFEQPPLPYGEDALAPQISSRTVGLHYGKHHKAYFDKLNKLVPGTPYADMELQEAVVASKKDGEDKIFNQAGQAWNHVFYWEQFKGGPTKPAGAFAQALERDFGGDKGLYDAFAKEGDTVFGTGWVWLVADGGKLAVKGYQDAGNPLPDGLTPLVGIDLWEHAYYLDYENRKAEHVAAVLSERINWQAAGERMGS